MPAIEIPSIRIHTGMLIAFTGHMRGWVLIEAKRDFFGVLGESMFGMAIQENMLDSFIGEMGNIIVGNLATAIYNEGISIDISTPTVVKEDTPFYGFRQSHHLKLHQFEYGEVRVFFKLEMEE